MFSNILKRIGIQKWLTLNCVLTFSREMLWQCKVAYLWLCIHGIFHSSLVASPTSSLLLLRFIHFLQKQVRLLIDLFKSWAKDPEKGKKNSICWTRKDLKLSQNSCLLWSCNIFYQIRTIPVEIESKTAQKITFNSSL